MRYIIVVISVICVLGDTIAQDITDDIIRDAMVFRQKHKRRDISYTDAIGYAFARAHHLLFLTGDKAFKDIPGVKHVPGG